MPLTRPVVCGSLHQFELLRNGDTLPLTVCIRHGDSIGLTQLGKIVVGKSRFTKKALIACYEMSPDYVVATGGFTHLRNFVITRISNTSHLCPRILLRRVLERKPRPASLLPHTRGRMRFLAAPSTSCKKLLRGQRFLRPRLRLPFRENWSR